ncbi:MAG: mandelate racemase/muconate lactonizing enzyme family protein [Candidatus Brocadiia bacterium]
MKIERIRTFIIGNPWKNWVIVRVETDEGLSGLGEATRLTARPQVAQVEELSRFVLGMDPRDPVRVAQRIYKGQFLVNTAAGSAIEVACWDILARSLDAPLYRLLGGRARERLRVYANGWYRCPREPDAFAERAAEVASMGYTALKFDPFGAAYGTLSAAEQRLSLDIVRAVRQAVGDDVDLLIEGHDRFDVSTAVRIGRALAEFSPRWFETPVNSGNISATVEVARQIPAPVAVGERFEYLHQFAELLRHGVVGIVQPEPLHIGGVNATMKAAGMAEAHGALVACHQAQSPLTTALNAHLHAAMPNFMIQECFDDFLVPWARDVFVGVPQVRDGHIAPSDAPGIGVELNEAEAAKHPYGEDKFIRLFEPGWESRDR